MKSWRLGKRIIGLGLVAVGIFVLLVVREANRVLETPIGSWSQDPVADCAVVLTGGAGRIREGLSLVEKGLIKTLVISGVNPNTDVHDLVTPMDQAFGANLPQVILERHSMTTYGNARQSAPILEALRCRDLVLVTSQAHMYRARKTFEAALPQTMRIIPHAVPSSRGETDSVAFATEVLKSLFYSIWAYS